jgi:5-methylcytosine-specific restriction endonuclease McrA
VIDRDGYLCGICGGDVEPTDVHLDHIYPYSLGGPTTFNNLRVTHSRCNVKKGARIE